MQIGGAVEQLVEYRHDPVFAEQRTAACEEPEHELDLPPLSLCEILLELRCSVLQHVLAYLFFLCIRVEYRGRNERDLEGLLDNTVSGQHLSSRIR